MTMFQNPADYWGLTPEQANRLPLGLRKSNNLFNVKYYGGAERNQSKWPGLLGPSEARDQGDPQMKFGSVDDSGVAGANLLRRKYDSGMTTPNQIIAGQNGWTPGYQGAANNVARLAGVESGDDLKLDSPDGMRRMLPALAEQEHGPDVAKRLFSDDMFDRIAERSTGAQFASGKLPGLSSKQFASDSELTPQEQDISSRRWDDAPTKPVQSESSVAGWNSGEQRATRQGARQPMDEEQQPELLDNLAGRTIYNPGFQQGLGLFLAASQGKDLNEGLNSGVARGGSLFAQHQKMTDMRRQQAAQLAIQRMFQDPNKFPDMPADVRAASLIDPSVGMNYINKHADPLERKKLQLDVDTKQRELDEPKTQWGQVGEDKFGGKTYGFVDTRAGKVTPYQNQNAAPAVTPGLVGEDYLKSIDPQVATSVKGIAEGRIPYPGAFALKQPYWQKIVEHLNQYEPQADANLYRTRYATQRDMSVGKMGQNLASFNTALAHMHDYYNQIDGLDNSSVPILNAPINAVRSKFSDTAQAKLNTAELTRSKVMAEVERAFKGTGATVSDLEHARHQLSVNDSPASQKAGVLKLIDLLEGRIEAVGDQYNRGMGLAQPRAAISLLSPKSQKIVESIRGVASPPGDNMVSSPSPAAPAMNAPVQGAKQAPDGNWYLPDPSRPGKFLRVDK